jgi:hypothetical protein
VLAECAWAGAALAGDGLGVLGAQAQGDTAAAQRVGGGTQDREELRLLGCFLDGRGEEALAPGTGLVFAEMTCACAWVADAMLGACEIAGDDEVEPSDWVPEGLERLTPFGEVF